MAELILTCSIPNPSGNEIISKDVSDPYPFLCRGLFSEREGYVVITQKMSCSNKLPGSATALHLYSISLHPVSEKRL